MRVAHLSLVPLAFMSCALPTSAADLLATRQEHVCVGDAVGCDASPPSDFGKVTMSYGCFDGGRPGGYKPNYVCNQICGSPYGPHCGHYTEPTWSQKGGQCGWRWAIVTCY